MTSNYGRMTCAHCGVNTTDNEKQMVITTEPNIPLAVLARSYNRAPPLKGGLRIIALGDEHHLLLRDVPTLCHQCFRKQMKQAVDDNAKMTMHEFCDFLRRPKVH